MSENPQASVTVLIPEPLRACTEGLAEVSVEGGSVADALARLVAEYPEIGPELITEQGGLRHGVVIAVDGRDIRFSGGLGTRVAAGQVIQIVAPMLV